MFTNKTDPDIAKEIVLASSDLYAREVLVDGLSGTVDMTDDEAVVLTPSPAVAWTPSAYVGKQIVIDGKAFTIDANDATTLTFDSTTGDVVLPVLVEATTYYFRIQDTALYLGLSEGKEFNVADEKVQLKDGVPRTLIREDVVERILSSKGTLKNFNFAILTALLSLKDKSITGYRIGTGGTNPSPRKYYEFYFQTNDVEGNAVQLDIFYGQIFNDGPLPLDSDTYKMMPYTISGYQDRCRTVAAQTLQDENLFRVKIQDTTLVVS